jgi:hypothetical protein
MIESMLTDRRIQAAVCGAGTLRTADAGLRIRKVGQPLVTITRRKVALADVIEGTELLF